jgi:hypothetical protein
VEKISKTIAGLRRADYSNRFADVDICELSMVAYEMLYGFKDKKLMELNNALVKNIADMIYSLTPQYESFAKEKKHTILELYVWGSEGIGAHIMDSTTFNMWVCTFVDQIIVRLQDAGDDEEKKRAIAAEPANLSRYLASINVAFKLDKEYRTSTG